MIPSSRQEIIYNTWTSTDNNILIEAVAGGAKTTTLMGILERSEYRTLFLAFNKSIQEEIQAKIEERGFQHAKAMTIHSLGLSAIRNTFGNKNVVINNSKKYSLIKYLQQVEDSTFKRMIWDDRVKVTMTLFELNDLSRLFLTNDLSELFEHMKIMDKYYFEHPSLSRLWETFLQIRETEDNKEKKEIDFTDMIYFVVKYNLFIPVQPYYLLIDEAQDLNLAQHKFIDLLVSQGDIQKWVAVGDRRQSIYGFSGAFASSFDLFKEKENVVELPLDVCYRCPVRVIEEANDVYDVMTGFKTDEGIVEDLDDYIEIKDGSMVICRNSGPLIDLYFKLLSNNRKVYIKGDDILASITRFLNQYKGKTVAEMISKVNKEIKRLSTLPNKGDRERIDLYRLKENYSNIMLLKTHFRLDTDFIDVLSETLKSLFVELNDPDTIMLCTIHKSKGLEADIVYILDEFLIPSKFAKSKVQLEQERNLKYVARTRAKEELYYLTLGKKETEEF